MIESMPSGGAGSSPAAAAAQQGVARLQHDCRVLLHVAQLATGFLEVLCAPVPKADRLQERMVSIEAVLGGGSKARGGGSRGA